MSKPRYATIPITLLQNVHEDQGGTIRQMINYAIYDRMIKEFPDIEETELDLGLIKISMEYLSIKPEHLKYHLTNGKEIYHKHRSDPNASISIEILLKFQKEKTEFELMVFSFYCAMRSLIGTKVYYKGTDNYWILRAFGYSSKEDFENNITTSQNRDLIAKYSKRYWLDKIKLTLQNDWHLIYLSTNKHIKIRGFYVSYKISYEQLVLIAKGKNEKYKSKKTVREETLARIFGKSE